jgi:hypothetical protein
MAESFVYKLYKGKEITLPLTDSMRKFLTARSKDNLIRECDEVWANLNNRPDEDEEIDEGEEDVLYSDLTKPELISEVNDRNKEREEGDKIVVPSGAKKDDIIALLEADDDANDDEDDSTPA